MKNKICELSKSNNSKNGFTLVETLTTLLIIGIVFVLIISSINTNRHSADIVKYRKIHDNLLVAINAVKFSPTGLNMTLTSDPNQVIGIISKQISTNEIFPGCRYDNLTQLIDEEACNATNVKGAVLSDGTPISFVANNDNTNLDNNLITKFNKKLKRGLVGAIVVNNDKKDLDAESIILVYEDGLGDLVVARNNNILGIGNNGGNPDNTPENNCNAIDHVWLNGKCDNPSEENCSEAGSVFYKEKCVTPTQDICQELGKVLFNGQCRNCSSEFINDLKEAYNILKDTIDKSIVTNGPISGWIFNKDGWRSGNPPNATFFATKYIVPYMDVDYTCTYSANSPKCFYGSKNEFYGMGSCSEHHDTWRNCPGLRVLSTYTGPGQSYMFRLKNGMSVAVSEYSKNSVLDVRVLVDIDGPDVGQSVTGIDLFEFIVSPSKGLAPFWVSSEDDCHVNNTGNPCNGAQYTGGGQSSCAYRIIQNDWKRPEDYPFCHE